MDMKDFLNVLASKEPVPGGGGACGYVAAVGMALGNMVLSLTTGKKKYAEYQEEIEELIVKAGDITNRLYECMDKDAKAFKPLSEAYGLPKDTEEQLEHRNKVMENALLIASEAPLSMMELIVEAIKLIDRISVIGSRLAISDAGVGVQMCKAAHNGASLNMYINTGKTKIKRLIVFRDNPPHNGGMPCGACREFLMQLDKANKNMEILTDYETRTTIKLSEVLPNWWGNKRYDNN